MKIGIWLFLVAFPKYPVSGSLLSEWACSERVLQGHLSFGRKKSRDHPALTGSSSGDEPRQTWRGARALTQGAHGPGVTLAQSKY